MRIAKKGCRALLPAATLLAGLALRPDAVAAHPHVWVDARAQLLFDGDGRLTGFRHDWLFDEGYSAFAVTGLDADRDGTLTRDELAPLAKDNMEALANFAYYTFPAVGDDAVALGAPVDYHVDYTDGRARLHFTLPLRTPLDVAKTGAGRAVSFRIYDPTFFVDFAFAGNEPLTLAAGAPPGCRTDYRPPAARNEPPRRLSEADFSDPDIARGYATSQSSPVHLVCTAGEGQP